MDDTLKVSEIMMICDVTRETVNRWIKSGYLGDVPKSNKGRNGTYLIKKEALDRFMQSDKYVGHPENFAQTSPSRRIPEIEHCWPVNLLIDVLQINLDGEECEPTDIWDYDMRRFKYMIGLLTDKEQRVLDLIYHLGLTLDETGSIFCVGRERIRQIREKAKRKLRWMISNSGCKTIRQQEFNELKSRYKEAISENNKLMAKLKYGIANGNKSDDDNRTESATDIFVGQVLLEELDLSVRAYNCLKRYGFSTLGELISFDMNQDGKRGIGEENYKSSRGTWQGIRNLGRHTLIEVANKIFEFSGYKIRYFDTYSGTYTNEIPLSCESQSGGEA